MDGNNLTELNDKQIILNLVSYTRLNIATFASFHILPKIIGLLMVTVKLVSY